MLGGSARVWPTQAATTSGAADQMGAGHRMRMVALYGRGHSKLGSGPCASAERAIAWAPSSTRAVDTRRGSVGTIQDFGLELTSRWD